MLHSSAILPPLYAVDHDDLVGHRLAARGNTHELPSIMGDVHDQTAHHLVARRYLVLEEYAAVGEGGRELGDGPYFAFAAGRLAGNQFSVADVVGGEHLI
jgi:hypothetical protein